MMRLILILLGVDYLRSHWRGLRRFGWVTLIAGTVIFIDAMDGVLYFPIEPFAFLLLIEGGATLLVAHSGMGGQRILRYVKGATFSLAAVLILAGNHDGNIVLAMIFGTLFLLDGALQIASAIVVRYRRWRPALVGGVVEIALAIFFYQPWPSNYTGTVPYCLGLGLAFAGWNMFILANRVKVAAANPGLKGEEYMEEADTHQPAVVEWDGPPDDDEKALTVHVWTPVGSAPGETISRPVISRYIAAVDKNGVISTGHAALESLAGFTSVYIPPLRSIAHRMPSPACYAPRPKITCRVNFSRITSPNPVNGATPPARCGFAITAKRVWRHSGKTTAKTNPII